MAGLLLRLPSLLEPHYLKSDELLGEGNNGLRITDPQEPGILFLGIDSSSSFLCHVLLISQQSCIKETSNSQNLAMKGTAEVGNATAACDKKFILELQPAQRGLQSQVLEADLVLWTVGSKPIIPQLDSSSYFNGIALNGRGQAETNETLPVRGHPRIFAIDDSSALRDSSGKVLPATAQVAFQEADFAGWNLWAVINDRPLLPCRFQNLGEMMTLGRSNAAITPSFIEGLTLEDPIGHAARKMAYLLRLPTDEHQLKVGVSWLTKSATDAVSLLQSSIAKDISGS